MGERVAVRDYIHKQKWFFGVIDEQVGELHYNVKLDDRRFWKRHVDQMRKVGEMIVEPTINREQSNAENIQQCPFINNNQSHENTNVIPQRRQSITIPKSQNSEVIEVEPSIPTIPEEVEGNMETTPSLTNEPALRCSNRVRKKPLRLLD